MRIHVEQSAPGDWDEFVQGHPGHSVYHLAAGVGIGAAAFGLETFYLSARDDSGALLGVLPLVEQSSRWFGRFLTSLPFVTYGGILSRDEACIPGLLAEAAALGRNRSARHVELRHSAALPESTLPERLDKVSMVLPLPQDGQDLMGRISPKLRSRVRRAMREDPELAWGGCELLDEFYRVFSRGMRDLGTPVYPRSFFEAYWNALGGHSRAVVIRSRGETGAVAIVVRHGMRLEVPWAAATPDAKRTALNVRLYWEILRQAIAEGAAEFDFGRSTRDGGTFRFKAQWGAKPRQLHWHYCLPAGGQPPVLNASNPKYSLASAMWRRLPLWCANALGPHLVRHLP